MIASASISEAATEPTTKIDSSEFGVPTTIAPAKYSWLGAIELPTELASGVITMGVRSYVPQLGRFLQPDPIPGGSANAYSYTFGDPVNSSDPSGEYTFVASYVEGADEKLDDSATEREEARVAAEAGERRAAQEASGRVAAEIAAFHTSYTAYTTTMRVAAEVWDKEAENEEYGYSGGGGRFANNEDPDDHSPRVESECNRTGQGCSGTRGGGPPSPNTGRQNMEEVCTFTWWMAPIGAVCGVGEAVKYIVNHTK